MKAYFVIMGVLAVIIASLIALSVSFQRTLQMETAEQFNKQQQLLANAEASNIQAYLDGLKNKMLHIAYFVSRSQVRREADFAPLTDVVFKDMGNAQKRIELLDGSGKILFTRGELAAKSRDGKSLVEMTKKGCPGDALINQDTERLFIAAPICRSGSLHGAMVLSLDIQDVARTFLSPIKSGARGHAWMMDEKGNLLYHPTQPDMVGRNLYKTDSSCFKCHKTFDAEKRIIEGKGDYYGRYVAPTGEDKILAFSTAAVGGSRWIVAVSAPYSEVTVSIKRSMKLYSWIIILIFTVTSGISALLIVLYRKREKAEERAKHEKELEMMHSEKLAALERLTSGITSEIGNPLTSVFSFIRVLMDMEEDEFKKETIETIFFHMNRISDIMKQLSGFSRMLPVELKLCRVNSIIENSLSLIQYDKRIQGITIMKELMPDVPALTTDVNRLSQVIVNIVLNAADAMPHGGTLTIRSMAENNCIMIVFEDTGIGIDKENLDRIFEPFYTTKEDGTGLGLAVSYSIIRKLNGNLTAESELNKGSRFVITLPMNGGK
ncbi:MAG: ATP-binding protein [Thermodesulfovibrionales bacterium]